MVKALEHHTLKKLVQCYIQAAMSTSQLNFQFRRELPLIWEERMQWAEHDQAEAIVRRWENLKKLSWRLTWREAFLRYLEKKYYLAVPDVDHEDFQGIRYDKHHEILGFYYCITKEKCFRETMMLKIAIRSIADINQHIWVSQQVLTEQASEPQPETRDDSNGATCPTTISSQERYNYHREVINKFTPIAEVYARYIDKLRLSRDFLGLVTRP